jgi:hypothetical protein
VIVRACDRFTLPPETVIVTVAEVVTGSVVTMFASTASSLGNKT